MPQVGTDDLNTGTLGAAQDTVIIASPSASAVSAQVTGTFSGTITWEGNTDRVGSNWGPIPASKADGSGTTATTAVLAGAPNNVTFVLQMGAAKRLRARCSSYTSGTATVHFNASLGAVDMAPFVTQAVSGTVAATQSGTWTVQPGNTANTTAWKVDGSAVIQPVSGTVTGNQGTQGAGGAASWQVQGAAAVGAALSGSPIRNGVSDGTNIQDQTGNLSVANILSITGGTTAQDSPAQVNVNCKGVYIFLNITAASGTGGLTPQLAIKDPGGAGSYFIAASLGSAQTATGLKCYLIYPGGPTAGALTAVASQGIPHDWRVHISVGDASSYTYTVSIAYIL